MNLIFSYHGIEELLKKKAPRGTLFVAKKNNRASSLIQLAKDKNVSVQFVDEAELDSKGGGRKHKGVLFEAYQKPEGVVGDYKEMIRGLKNKNPLVVLLDSITDPHNFGAILRSADQFYVDLVITTERRSARETGTVAATSAGANVYVKKAVVPNLVQVVEFLKKEGFWIYGADMDGQDSHKLDLKGKTAIVMGSEGKGLRRLIKEHCDGTVKIPTRGNVDSLNVSVAAGILLYETRRQQGFEK